MGAPPHLVRIVAALSLTALPNACQQAPDTLDTIHQRGFLRVGYAQEAPYSFVDRLGTVHGESVEALRHALGPIGVDSVRWILIPFSELIPRLLDGDVDAVAAGVFITDERRLQVSFSQATLCSRPALARRSAMSEISGLEDFVGLTAPRLAVLEGSVEARAAEIVGVARDRLVLVPRPEVGLGEVRSGVADALSLSAPTLAWLLRSDTVLTWRTYSPPEEVMSLLGACAGIAFRPQDRRLLEAVDAGLTSYLGSDAHAATLRDLGIRPDQLQPMPGAGR